MTFDPGPLHEVSARQDGGGWILEFTLDLPHSRERVWQALTDPEELAQWAPFTADRSLDRTGAAVLTMIDRVDPADLPIEVLHADPPVRLDYTWGTDRLRWDLVAIESGTRLTLQQAVAGSDWLAKVAAGWHLCLLVVEKLLDGQPIPPIRGLDAMHFGWQELYERYGKVIDQDR